MPRKRTTKQWIIEAEKVHDNKFDYSLVDYKKWNERVIIICPVHGEFTQSPNDHLRGHGCSECNGGIKYSTKSFIEKANKKFNNKFDYSLVDYKNIRTKIKIICPNHGIFEQTPRQHFDNKYGCKDCGNQNKLGIDLVSYYATSPKGFEDGHLYQLEVSYDNEIFYKVGVTSMTIRKRWGNTNNYKIIDDIILSNYETSIIERNIHSNNKHLRYIPKNNDFGNSECYLERIDI